MIDMATDTIPAFDNASDTYSIEYGRITGLVAPKTETRELDPTGRFYIEPKGEKVPSGIVTGGMDNKIAKRMADNTQRVSFYTKNGRFLNQVTVIHHNSTKRFITVEFEDGNVLPVRIADVILYDVARVDRYDTVKVAN